MHDREEQKNDELSLNVMYLLFSVVHLLVYFARDPFMLSGTNPW